MINLNKVKTYSVKSRFSKVAQADFAKNLSKGSSFDKFYESLPKILKGKELHSLVDSLVIARKKKKSVIFMAGAHVIKCGLNPVVIELLKRRIINCICLNGAGIIHDSEVAYLGRTSEDVSDNLKDGKFGMGRETAEFINSAVREGIPRGLGLGSAVSKKITDSKFRYKKLSLLANAHKYNVPVCVFVAVGTDIIHQHPSFDAALSAEGSFRDFKALAEKIIGLNNGGVVLNFGSAVILPEVFLKALNLARNLGNKVVNFTSANFDMIYHYRPAQNVCLRPTLSGGKSFYIIGHHEIMLPLLAQSVIEKI